MWLMYSGQKVKDENMKGERSNQPIMEQVEQAMWEFSRWRRRLAGDGSVKQVVPVSEQVLERM